jgi:NitT/TauT family transport system substrate-binding protein
VKIQARAWDYLRSGHIDEGVEAMLKQRPDAKLDAKVTREQIRLTIDFFDTPATEGKPIGWQAEQDWVDALRSLEAAGAIKAGWKPSDYYTNELIH